MKVRTAPLLAISALLVGTLLPLAAPAAADAGPVPLDMSRQGRVLLDEARGHLFLSPARVGAECA